MSFRIVQARGALHDVLQNCWASAVLLLQCCQRRADIRVPLTAPSIDWVVQPEAYCIHCGGQAQHAMISLLGKCREGVDEGQRTMHCVHRP